MSRPTITQAGIESLYQACLDQCAAKIPLGRWQHTPRGVALFRSKTDYGNATKDGQVLINELFLGTTDHERLDQVIRHELAHLAVGLRHNHDRTFKRVADYFGACYGHSTPAEQVLSKIRYRWGLYAYVAGERLHVKNAHRRDRRYTHYDPEKRRLKIDGQVVERFEYGPACYSSILNEA